MVKHLAAALILSGWPLMQAAAEQGVIEEIIVTAQKREQRVQDVPISMSVLDSESLELRGFSRLDDIAFAVPNLAITNPVDARTAQFTMRGITGQTFFPGAESAVGIFIDGVYVNNPIGQNFDLVDVERIEVLRGPQGTLYGKNSTAGAINIVSRRPSDVLEGGLLAEYGRLDHQRLRGDLSGPLSERVSGSLAASFHKRDGYQSNEYLGEELSTADAWNVRGALRLMASDRLEVNLSADYLQEDRVPSIPDPTPEDRELWLSDSGREEREVYGAALTVEYSLGSRLDLTSITAVRDYDHERVGDDDGTPLDAFISPTSESTLQISQELRLNRNGDHSNWVAGLYYLNTDLEGGSTPILDPDQIFELNVGLSCTTLFTGQLIGQGLPPDLAAATAAGLCAPGTGDNRIDQDSQTWAAFGEFAVDLAERLTLTAGVRVSWEEKEFRNRQLSPSVPLFLAYPVDASFDRTDTSVSPKLALQWHQSDRLVLYATTSNGFKSGGFNTAPVADVSQLASTEFGEETLWNYELGGKFRSADGRLRLDVAGFYIDYDDLQVFRFEELAVGVFSSRITNAAVASSYGLEMDLSWAATDQLTVSAGLGWVEAEYDDFDNCGVTNSVPAQPIDCTGNAFTNAPDLTGNLNLLYRRPIGNGLAFTANGEVAYRGEVYYDVFNNEDARQEGFFVANATLGIGAADGRWAVELWGTNLTDEDYITIAVQGFGGERVRELGAPRMYGLRLTGRL